MIPRLGRLAAAVGALLALSCASSLGAVGEVAFVQARDADPGLTGARGVTVSPDGRNVYVAGQDADAVVAYSRAADGTISPLGCISDTGAPGCATSTDGLNSARFIAVSPDGASVYVTGGDDQALVAFSRDGSTGALTPAGCWKDTASAATCASTTAGLAGAEGVAVSPDGRNVYVAGQDQDTLVTFARSTQTGSLSAPSCIEQTGSPADCGEEVPDLDAPRELALSPDGTGVYVAAATSDAVVAFLRAPATGVLTPAGTAGGIDLPVGVAVSPDSRNVYAGGVGSDAVVAYSRDPSTSGLTPAGCAQDAGAVAGCATTAEGLAGVEGVAVAPDGGSVYAAGASDSAVVAMTRGAAGALGPLGCLRIAPGGAGCGSAAGLGGAHGVAVSPDGANVYVTGFTDAAVTVLRREAPPSAQPPPAEPPATAPAPAPVPLPEEPGAPPPVEPSGPATSIVLELGGRMIVAGGVRGVQVRTNGTCLAAFRQTVDGTGPAERDPLFLPAGGEIRRAGRWLLPVRLTARGTAVTRRQAGPVRVPAALSCAPVRYPSSDPAGFGSGTPVRVAARPDPARPQAERVELLDPGADPGGVPTGLGFRVRWKAPPPPGGGPTVTFDVVDGSRVENLQVTGGVASCIGAGGALSARRTDFLEFSRESVAIDRTGQVDIYRRLAVPGDQIRLAQLHITFAESSVGRDTAGGTLKFDFRAGDGGCGLLVNFTARPERIEVPPAARVEYNGDTARGGEVTFNLAGGRRIDDLRMEVHMSCRWTSAIFGGAPFSAVHVMTADTIPVQNGAFRVRSASGGDGLTLIGTVTDGRVEGEVLASRALASGAGDTLACGSDQIAFTAAPGRRERRGDRDGDGVRDDADRCPTVSDAGDPAVPRTGCPNPAGTSSFPDPDALLRCAGQRSAEASATPGCGPQDVFEAFARYAHALSDVAIDSFRVLFVEGTIPALAAPEDRAEMAALGRDLYALYRLPLRNLIHEELVAATPPQLDAVQRFLLDEYRTFGGQGFLVDRRATLPGPNCSLFRPEALQSECRLAYRALVQTVCDASLEIYRRRWELARKGLLPGSNSWAVATPGRFGPIPEGRRCLLDDRQFGPAS